MNTNSVTIYQSFQKFFIFAALGVVAAFFIGLSYSGSITGAFSTLFLTLVLSILEISLSFDNSVVDATILKKMTPLWQHRFLSWGIFIAVFGMRFLFPLLLVAVMARLNPFHALILATTNPNEYARIMFEAHGSIAAYGGSFLLLVALKYFFKINKEVYWISIIEKPISSLGRLEATKIAITLITLCIFSSYQMEAQKTSFLASGIWGTITFIMVDGIGAFLHGPDDSMTRIDLQKASMGMFIYLEILDASFSFDGVVGAFAITNQLFIIMIGLGIGAVFMRSLTIMLVKKGTIHQYRYLEHGAFYAMGILSLIMFVGTIKHIPEIFTGLIGISVIGLSVWSSIRFNKKQSISVSKDALG